MTRRLIQKCRGIKHLFEAHTVPIKKAEAARAVFQDADYSEIEVTLIAEDGTKLILTMSPRIARPLIEQMTIAYEAINPQLRRGGYGAQMRGMDF